MDDLLNDVVFDQHQALFDLLQLPGNTICVDCNESNPKWASLGFGTLICLTCAGFHRSIGTHITTVRSIELDKWTSEQVQALELGGNKLFLEYLRSHYIKPKSGDLIKFYSNPIILHYSEILKAKIESRPPKELDPENYTLSEKNAYSPTQKKGPTDWISDKAEKACMVCGKEFSIFNRRHHCRRCGKLACNNCAPAENTRPIMEWGFKDPVRHCKLCYKSPSVSWKD